MKILVLSCVAAMVMACGGKGGSGTGTDGGNTTGDGGGTVGDGGGPVGDGGGPDGGVAPGCTPGATQCSNCIDDDGDERIDGFDPQCTGAADNDEATFATGIPGDNMDAVSQDCFFDGDSGAGNDGCKIHVCCLLGAMTVSACPAELGRNTYDPTECPPPIGTVPLDDKCIEVCGKLTPPGCDCFGCCSICDPTTNECADILINPTTSPDCTNDPTKCPTCIKNDSCTSVDCNSDPNNPTCVLCPGQDPEDLPDTCTSNTCPTGQVTCGADLVCPTGTYCSNGCCIGTIIF